jgi:hypothetical protein
MSLYRFVGPASLDIPTNVGNGIMQVKLDFLNIHMKPYPMSTGSFEGNKLKWHKAFSAPRNEIAYAAAQLPYSGTNIMRVLVSPLGPVSQGVISGLSNSS